jgi:hypothetical protein
MVTKVQKRLNSLQTADPFETWHNNRSSLKVVLFVIQKWKDFNGNGYLQGVKHAAPYCDHFGLLWQNTKILRFGQNLALIISCYVLTLFLIHTTSTCIVRLGDICNALRYSNQYFIFGILIGHDLSMRILYRFHGWLIFARVISLFMFVWPCVHPHILCTQLVICVLSHFIHIWYLGWPWSEHAHIIPISRMVDFCASSSPFHVCLTIRPFAHLGYATSHLSFVALY